MLCSGSRVRAGEQWHFSRQGLLRWPYCCDWNSAPAPPRDDLTFFTLCMPGCRRLFKTCSPSLSSSPPLLTIGIFTLLFKFLYLFLFFHQHGCIYYCHIYPYMLTEFYDYMSHNFVASFIAFPCFYVCAGASMHHIPPPYFSVSHMSWEWRRTVRGKERGRLSSINSALIPGCSIFLKEKLLHRPFRLCCLAQAGRDWKTK